LGGKSNLEEIEITDESRSKKKEKKSAKKKVIEMARRAKKWKSPVGYIVGEFHTTKEWATLWTWRGRPADKVVKVKTGLWASLFRYP
jgi:hypothetical protein